MKLMVRRSCAFWLLFCLSVGAAQAATFSVTLAPAQAREPLNGRLLLLLSVDPGKEPRFQIDLGAKSQQVFGIDVSEWRGRRGAGLRLQSPRLPAPEPRGSARGHVSRTGAAA